MSNGSLDGEHEQTPMVSILAAEGHGGSGGWPAGCRAALGSRYPEAGHSLVGGGP